MLINPDLEVVVGCNGSYHKNDMKRIINIPEHVENVFHYARTFHTLKLTEEELVIMRGVVVTFRGRYNKACREWVGLACHCFFMRCKTYN